MKQIRVLMLSKACVVGTYQRKLEEMAKQPDLALKVLVPPSWRDDRGILHLERAHVTGYELETIPIRFNGSFHLHHFPTFGRYVRDFRPDVIHIDEEPYNWATWHALWQARESGAQTLFFSWQNINRRYPWVFRQGEQWVLRRVDYAIMGTTSAAEVWRAKGYTGPYAVIPQFGVDPALFTPPVCARQGDPFVIGFVGRLVEEKGGTDLLDALATINRAWRLAVIGDGPHRAALEVQAERLGISSQVTFDTLPSFQMPGYYQGIDVLAVPSRTRPNWKEQFGRVIIEAMACGVPVIGSDSGAIPDVIGDAGVIVPEGDTIALAEQLRVLMQSPELRQNLGRLGRQRVLERFTQAQVAAQTVDVYRTMLAGSARQNAAKR